MAKVGRPTRYNKTLARDICDLIMEGYSVREIAEKEEMPALRTIMKWLGDEDKTEFMQQYTRACKTRSLLQLEDIQAIADDGRNDWMERNGYDVENREVTGRSKLRVEARFRIHDLMYPKKYKDDSEGIEPLPRIQVELINKSDKDGSESG